jgi:hypothetical protein
MKAWKDGPVVPQVWHERKEKESRLAVSQDLRGIELDNFASDLIDLVIRAYGSMSAEELSALTHTEDPWNEARGDLPEDAPGQEPIRLESMAQFYRAHRKLGGRTAADLAAGGIYLRSAEGVGPVDVDAILSSLGDAYNDSDDDTWGGGNLCDSTQYDPDGIEHEPHRAYFGP